MNKAIVGEPIGVYYSKELDITSFRIINEPTAIFYLINHNHVHPQHIREGRLVSFEADFHNLSYDLKERRYIIRNASFRLGASIKKVLNKYEVAIKIVGHEELTCKQVGIIYGVSSDVVRRHVHNVLQELDTGMLDTANLSAFRRHRGRFMVELIRKYAALAMKLEKEFPVA